MKNTSQEQKQSKREGLLPKLARKIGENSVNQTCFSWIHQPKVPESMKNNK